MFSRRWVVVALAMLICCGEHSLSGVKGTYENVKGTTTVRFRDANEVELEDKGSPIFLGTYSIEPDGRVRVVAEALGTTMVFYLQNTELGLVAEEDGETFYSEKSIVQAREEFYCELVTEAVMDKVASIRKTRKSGELIDRAGSKTRTDVHVQAAGITGEYFFIKGLHENCPRYMVFDSRAREPFWSWATQEEAVYGLGDVMEEASAQIESEKQRIAQEAEREAQRMASLVSKAKTPTKTLGTFRTKYFFNGTISTEFREVEIVVTDVDVRGYDLAREKRDFRRFFPGATSAWFGWITKCIVEKPNPFYPHADNGVWLGFNQGRSTSPDTSLSPVFFSESVRDEFAQVIEAAVSAWRTEHYEAWPLRQKAEESSSFECDRR